jgi:Ca2+-binding RTX toxin-like protein
MRSRVQASVSVLERKLEMSRIGRGAIVAVAVGSALSLGGASASAAGKTKVTSKPVGSGTNAGHALIVRAAPGEANRLSASYTSREGGFRGVRLQDTAGIEAPDVPGCSQISATRVRCTDEGLRRLDIVAGDGDDRVQFASEAGSDAPPVQHLLQVRMDGGRGNDTLGYQNEYAGGATQDMTRILAGRGNDTVNAVLAPVPGGASISRQLGLIKLGDGRDTVRVSGPFTVYGQAGNDRLVGGFGAQRLLGGAGRDRLAGGEGAGDVCDGGAATDKVDASCEEILNP